MSTAEFVRGFGSAAVLKVAIVNIIGGILMGYIIGFVGVYDTLNGINQNCTRYETEIACGSLHHANCMWDVANNTCLFADFNCKSIGNDQDMCDDHDMCQFDHKAEKCEHQIGLNAVKVGIFAAAMTVGGMMGATVGSFIINHIGRRPTIILSGLICVAGSLIIHLSRAFDIYALLVIARVFFGMGGGLLCVVAPMYIEEMAPEAYRSPLGVFFQLFCTLGIFMAAAVGLIVEPMNTVDEQNNEVRIQMVMAVETFISVLCVVVGILIPESKMHKKKAPGADADQHLEATEEDDKLINNNAEPVDHTVYPLSMMVGPLLIATALSVAQQMTGINAIMSYAPIITSSMGLRPLMGNFVVMLWNFITTIISVPLSSRLTMRQMYIGGSIVASLAQFVVGIPMYPGLASDTVVQIFAGFGIFLFILAFECGMGPAFYVLCQQLFPNTFRPKGSSFTITIQFIFNIIINVCFPIAVQNLSGGPSGNQNMGMSLVFMFFGTTGLLSWVVLYFFLHPFKATSDLEPNPEQ